MQSERQCGVVPDCDYTPQKRYPVIVLLCGEHVTEQGFQDFASDNAGLEATNRYGVFFINSIFFFGATTLAFSLWMLLRLVLLQNNLIDAETR